MAKKKRGNNILGFLKLIYIKLFRIHDTPQKIAQGVGLGVFLGILPATGPIAAVTLAFLLRANRAAALLGSLVTNTWISVLTFFLSIRIGSTIMKRDWQDAYRGWTQLLNDFKITSLFKLTAVNIILPVLIGYLLVGFCLGLIAYLVTLVIFIRIRDENKNRTDIFF